MIIGKYYYYIIIFECSNYYLNLTINQMYNEYAPLFWWRTKDWAGVRLVFIVYQKMSDDCCHVHFHSILLTAEIWNVSIGISFKHLNWNGVNMS